KVLHQSGNENSTSDGMDIAICAFNKEMTRVEYAGANRPMWVIRNGNMIVEEIKATKAAIGGYTIDEQEFAKHEIDLQKNDTVYLFSDGFADQFGFRNNKKLKTKNFKEEILVNQFRSMEDQKIHLNSFIEIWKGNMEQTDDILVVGIRV
ncbi:MAG: serine/threonine-protein phosphatase, partial [Bacteroidetes bacterium]|nr:serine/threonine-protein phosphatase [Bacteroidota bacterium]